jgi:metallo-beta-lactamase family protein
MNQLYEVIHHGGNHTVTGSCHELRLNDAADNTGILIDCGLLQGEGSDTDPQINFPIDHIRALIVTHVHIDHVGRIPQLLAAGFKGPIFCSEPSATLLPLVLEDAVKVGITRDKNLIWKFIRQIKKQIIPVPYGSWTEIDTGSTVKLSVRLKPAGHILGSAYVEARIRAKGKDQRVVFSGDLGAPYTPLLPAPKSPYRADRLIIESTYGDRLHANRKNRRQTLQAIIEKALRDRGVILIPAFSIGRTQELLYEIEGIVFKHQKQFAAIGLPWSELEIIVDSPLASRFTGAYRDLKPYWDAEAKKRLRSGRHPLSFEQMTTIDTHEAHLYAVDYLKKTARPSIVIAASGMCAGGRIVNYLKAMLSDSRTDVLFVGYQAHGTPGRDVQNYGPRGGYVFLDGQKINIAAGIHTISGYSAHADQQNLINFVKRIRHKPKVIHLVHGETEAREALRTTLKELLPEVEIVI